jgi:hypothetical protein
MVTASSMRHSAVATCVGACKQHVVYVLEGGSGAVGTSIGCASTSTGVSLELWPGTSPSHQSFLFHPRARWVISHHHRGGDKVSGWVGLRSQQQFTRTPWTLAGGGGPGLRGRTTIGRLRRLHAHFSLSESEGTCRDLLDSHSLRTLSQEGVAPGREPDHLPNSRQEGFGPGPGTGHFELVP